MFKRILCVFAAAAILFTLAGCKKKDAETPDSPVPDSEQTVQENPYIQNTLTGVYDIDKDKANRRPVAIMVDNDSVAQTYTQSGISKADIVYETETEGGITRLMAVYADITKAPQIGDIRSARYVYVDLALGHNAIYVHCGLDKVYCAPHLKDIDNFEVFTDYYARRITYGKAKGWQTLFTDGETLWKGFNEKGWKTTADNIKNWQDFATENEEVTLSGTAANTVLAAFNGSYKSKFTYDPANKKYIKTSSHAENTDRNDSAPYLFKNVFILQTDMSYYPGNYRRKIDLTSGTGYYCTGGSAVKINWKKGDATNPFVFTNEDGTPLKVNAGNSWVCIAKKDAQISFE